MWLRHKRRDYKNLFVRAYFMRFCGGARATPPGWLSNSIKCPRSISQLHQLRSVSAALSHPLFDLWCRRLRWQSNYERCPFRGYHFAAIKRSARQIYPLFSRVNQIGLSLMRHKKVSVTASKRNWKIIASALPFFGSNWLWEAGLFFHPRPHAPHLGRFYLVCASGTSRFWCDKSALEFSLRGSYARVWFTAGDTKE